MNLIFDIEADGLLESVSQVWCIVAIDVDTKEIYQFRPSEIKKGLQFLSKADKLIGHNILMYDLPVLRKLCGWEYKGSSVDTLVMSATIRPDREIPKGVKSGPHSIEAWGVRLKLAKPKHEDWSQYSEEMLHRCTEDAKINWKVYKALHTEMEKDAKMGISWGRSLKLEHECSKIIQKQEENGWLLDVKKAEALYQKINDEMGDIERELVPILPKNYSISGKPVLTPFTKKRKIIGRVVKHYEGIYTENLVEGPFTKIEWHDFNLRSDVQTRTYLLSQGWVPTERTKPSDKFPNGQPKITDDSLSSIMGDLGKKLARYHILSARRSQLKNDDGEKGWLNLVRPDGRLPAKCRVQGTPTGRCRHAIIVNVPKADEKVIYGAEFRELFIAPPGYKMLGVDASSLEARMLCHYMADRNYTRAVLEGKQETFDDIHYKNAEAFGFKWKTEKEGKSYRNIAKNCFYACVTMDTQALTRVGWKSYKDVVVGEDVLTYNAEKNIKEWKPVLEKVYYEDAEVVEVSHSQGFKIKCTPNHRWFIKRRTGRKNHYYVDEVRETRDLNSECNIKMNAPYLNTSKGTDLSIPNYGKYQEDWVSRVLDMSDSQLQSFLAGFMLADGYVKGEGQVCQNSWAWSQNRTNVAEALILASYLATDRRLVLNGRINERNGREMIVCRISQKSHTTTQRTRFTPVDNQPVWCIKTENESWVIRQGDTITITGNTMYGAHAPKLASMMGVSEPQAQERLDQFYENLPKLKNLMDKASGKYKTPGFLIGLDGRRLQLRKKSAALNTLLQAAGAVVMKKAMVYADRYLAEAGIDFKQVGFFHDEFQYQVREDQAKEAGVLVVKAIRHAGKYFKLGLPLDGEDKIGDNWRDVH